MRVLLMLLLVAGCQPPPAKTKASPGDARRSLFHYAHPYVARAAQPARFAAPLPDSVSALADTRRYPPVGSIAAALDSGDPSMQERLVTAVRQAARRGRVAPALAAFYDRLFAVRPSSAACDFLLAQVGGSPRPARAVYWSALARCRGSKYAAAFARADTPDSAVVRWYATAGEAELPFTERIADASLAYARRGPLEARESGEALAHVEGGRALRAVRELQRKLRDPERRALVALGLARRDDDRARALIRRACAHPRVRFEPACSSLDAGFDLYNSVRGPVADNEILLRMHGEERVLDALVRCVEADEWDDERVHCLKRLAALDWARAAASAAAIHDGLASSSPLLPTVRVLARYPEPGTVADELRRHGLLDANETVERAIAATEILVEHGRAVRVEIESGRFPRQHDILIADLVRLVRPDLDGVVFEESPPVDARHRLRAWVDDRVFEVHARTLVDRPDVPAVVGLLNVLLRARGSEQRFLALAGGLDAVTVVGGPSAAIEAAVEAGAIAARGRPRL